MLRIRRTISPTTHGNAFVNQGFFTATMKKISLVVGGMFVGTFGYKDRIAFAHSENEETLIQQAINEILSHFMWETVGHVCKLSSFTTGLLGNLLTCQSLGEKDVFYIRNISKPLIIKCINPNTGKMEDGLKLANGKIIVGQDILRFCKDLHSATILRDLEKGKK